VLSKHFPPRRRSKNALHYGVAIATGQKTTLS
jgi:hypothetical protein